MHLKILDKFKYIVLVAFIPVYFYSAFKTINWEWPVWRYMVIVTAFILFIIFVIGRGIWKSKG